MLVSQPSWYADYVTLCNHSGVKPLQAAQVSHLWEEGSTVESVFIAAHGVEPFRPLSTEVPEESQGEDISDIVQLSETEKWSLGLARSIEEPRVDETYILSKVANITYTRLPEGRTIVCEVVMANGSTFTGSHTATTSKVYSEEAGKAAARGEAFAKATVCELYLLREEAYRKKHATVEHNQYIKQW